MSASLYRATLKRAFTITRRYKHLWLLGFLAALLGNGGEYEFALSQFNKLSAGEYNVLGSMVAMLGTGGSNVLNLVGGSLETLSSMGAVFLGAFTFVLLALVWLIVVAQGALVRSVAELGNSSRARLREHVSRARRSFWQLVAIIAATRLWSLFLFAGVGFPLIALLARVLEPGTALFVVIFALGIPIFIVFSMIAKYALAYCMVENQRAGQSLASALKLFASHWLVSAEMALALFAVNVIVGAAIVLFTLFVAIPFILFAWLLSHTGLTAGAGALLAIFRIIALLLLLMLGGALATFQYAAWTELFLRIRERRYLSKIMRIVMGWREKYT